MRVAGHAYNLMSESEVSCIHHNALRILAEVGMEVQNEALLRDLQAFGLPVDLDAQRVRFPASAVERYLAAAPKHDWDAALPQASASAGVYHGRYHDPFSGELVEWDEPRLVYYCALARHLEHVSAASMLGCRLPVPAELEPLYERYYCWKYGAEEGSSIYLDELCPFLFELYQLRAEALAQPLDQAFRGTVYLVPPLKLGRHEAYQVQWFRERGLRVGIGAMNALGANAPVTLAGGVALNVAEQIALGMLDQAWFGRNSFHLGCSLSVIDMRTMIYPYGRPEMAITNLMAAQMARFYGASFSGHAALSDAKLPSVESGYQKALTGIPTLLAGGSLWMDAGLLSIDEVCSPIQLILDNEFLSALKRFCVDYEISDESIGLEAILEAGPGGQFLDKEHTVRHMRREHWQPKLWSREMLAPWLDGPRQIDLDRARDIALQFRAPEPDSAAFPPAFERQVLALIERAQAALAR